MNFVKRCGKGKEHSPPAIGDYVSLPASYGFNFLYYRNKAKFVSHRLPMQIEACAAFDGFGNAADSDGKIIRWMFAVAITSTRERSFSCLA